MSQVANSWDSLTPSEIRNHQRAYVLLGNDLLKIFEYVEPVQANAACFGHQIYQLFLRVCTEFESVCKLACRGLDFQVRRSREGRELDWKIDDYKFYFHDWGVSETPIFPLESFENGQDPSPIFYKSYNAVKHDREKEFIQANLANLMNSFAALVAVLDWQGISVDSHIVADCTGETVIGARFGYFRNCESQELTARVNF